MNLPHRVTLSATTTNTLRQLAAKTGLSPNVLARFALLVSLNQAHSPVEDTGTPDLTINRSTLFGDIEVLLASALVASSEGSTSVSPKAISAHIARGAAHLQLRIASIADLAVLCTTH